MPSPKQRALLRRPNRLKPPPAMKMRRPTKDCPVCMNLIGKLGDARRHYFVHCSHKGYAYKVNGGFRMILCWCCSQKLRRRGISVTWEME